AGVIRQIPNGPEIVAKVKLVLEAAGPGHDPRHVALRCSRRRGWRSHCRGSERGPRRPYGPRHARARSDSAHVRVAVHRAQIDRSRIFDLSWDWLAPHQAERPRDRFSERSTVEQAICRRRVLQPIQSKGCDLLLRLSTAVRFSVGAASDAFDVGPGTRV